MSILFWLLSSIFNSFFKKNTCIFRDHRGTFMGCFACNLGVASVFEAELSCLLWNLLQPTSGATSGWKVIHLRLFLLSRTWISFLSVLGTVHIIVILVWMRYVFIFFVKETVVRTSWLVSGMTCLTLIGLTYYLLCWLSTSLGIEMACLITAFPKFSVFIVSFFLYLLKVTT